MPGGLFGAHLLDRAHNEDDPEGLGQIIDGSFQELSNVLPSGGVFGLSGFIGEKITMRGSLRS